MIAVEWSIRKETWPVKITTTIHKAEKFPKIPSKA